MVEQPDQPDGFTLAQLAYSMQACTGRAANILRIPQLGLGQVIENAAPVCNYPVRNRFPWTQRPGFRIQRQFSLKRHVQPAHTGRTYQVLNS